MIKNLKKKLHIIFISKRILLYIALSFTFILLLIFNSFLKNSRVERAGSPNNFSNLPLNQDIKGYVAIVIDDFGNVGTDSNKMVEINRPLTCAIIPFLDHSKEAAELAHSHGHEVIIHLPMEPHKGDPKWLGEKGITEKQTTKEIKDIVKEAIENIPYAVGLNNHMGSKATENQRIMEAIISVLSENRMYIIDSKTSPKSVVEKVAHQYNVPYLERMVFLDNKKDVYSIKQQIRKLGDLALENKYAIAIGHVGPEGGEVTVRAIVEMIPELEEMGIRIVPASQLLNIGNE